MQIPRSNPELTCETDKFTVRDALATKFITNHTLLLHTCIYVYAQHNTHTHKY